MNYKEFVVGDLFRLINNPQLDKCNFTFSETASYPYFTRTETNNGILGYVEYLDEEHKIQGNSLAVGMISMKFHYMEHDFYAGQFTKTAIPKFNGFNKWVAMYFTVMLNKYSAYYQGLLVRNFAEAFLNTKIVLPVDADNNIDLNYIEEYIKGFDTEMASDIQNYLNSKDFDSYELTPDERALLSKSVSYKEFRIGDLFEKLPASYKGKIKKQDNVSKTRTAEFNLPLINCKWGNNGIMYYGREEDFTHYENVLSIIYNGPPTVGTVYAQEKIGVYTDSYLVALKKEIMPEMSMMLCLYLKTAIEKAIHDTKYSRAEKATWDNKVENDMIILPVTNSGTPDFDYMEQYMRIQEKLVLKEINLYKEELLCS